MKTLEFLENNKYAVSIITKYYVKVMQESITEDMPDNFKEFVEQRGFTLDELTKLIDSNPRSLIDVFDDHDLNACLEMTFEHGKPIFAININGAIGSEQFTDRKEAEKQMVRECIVFLNGMA